MDAIRNYLASQADLGTDEVILAFPLAVRPPPSRASAPGAAALPEAAAPAARVAETAVAVPDPRRANASAGAEGPSAPPGLFQMLVKSLETSADAVKQTKAKGLGIPIPALAPIPAGKASEPALPAFGSLAEYRDYLEANIRGLLTGEAKHAELCLVHGTGPEFAPLALASLEPGAADARGGLPFQGESGALLEKMMRAIKLDIGLLYRTHVVKIGSDRKIWTRRDLVRLLPLFQAELGLAKASVVLLLGEACAQAVLKTGKSIDELRQLAHSLDGFPGREFVVTHHPEELLGSEDLKRKAWKDLQWLQQRLEGNRA